MRRARLFAAAGIAAAAMTIAGVAAPAASAQVDQPTILFLSISQGETITADAPTVSLTCSPTGGTHPSAAEVCAALDYVRGELEMADADPNRMCTMIYAPVTVSAFGFVGNRMVDIERTYGNACVMAADTGSLYQF